MGGGGGGLGAEGGLRGCAMGGGKLTPHPQ